MADLTSEERADKILTPFHGRIVGGYGIVIDQYLRDAEAESRLRDSIRQAIDDALAAREQDIERMLATMKRYRMALENTLCHCRCDTHGYGCGLAEVTCHLNPRWRCARCIALTPDPPAPTETEVQP